MAAGTVLALPPLWRAWNDGEGLARLFARWFALSYGLGLLSVAPGLLRHAGLPDRFCDGGWMNLFLFYPLLNRLKHSGMVSGGMAVMFLFTCQYVLLLAALVRARRQAGRQVVPHSNTTH